MAMIGPLFIFSFREDQSKHKAGFVQIFYLVQSDRLFVYL
jgi:hypothetical protein